MASPKLFAEVVIAGSYKNLAKSTRGATKELKNFQASTKKIANAVKGLLSGVALMGVGAVYDALIDMTKAAQEDAKSMALLNKQMELSWKATDKTKKSMNDYIDSVARMTGIMDDDLRPAFSKIVRVTKNAAQATKVFDNVLNISAATGKDVNTVAQAYSRYLDGNKTALYRLIPGLKGAKNEAKFLHDTYAGMADLAGKNDPFARITVIMEDFKEKLGASFLPILNSVADWLASPEATKQMDRFAKAVQDGFAWFSSDEGKESMNKFLDNMMKIADAINDIIENIDKLQPLIDFFMTIQKLQGGWIFDLFGGGGDKPKNKNSRNVSLGGSYQPTSMPSTRPSAPPIAVAAAKPANVTITVNAPNVSGPAVVDALKRAANTRGIPMSKLLA